MAEHFSDNEWHARSTGDFALRDAADRSLDSTVDHAIGREIFNFHLDRHRKLNQLVMKNAA